MKIVIVIVVVFLVWLVIKVSSTSTKSNFCFVSDKDFATYQRHPKWNYSCIEGPDPIMEFEQSMTPEFQSRGIPFPNLQPLPPKLGYGYEYLY